MLNRSAWPPVTSPRREVAKSAFSRLAPEIRGSYFDSNARSRLRPTHRTACGLPFFEREVGIRNPPGRGFAQNAGAGPEKSCRAPERDGCRRPSPTLALVLASLVSIPFLFLKRRKKRRPDLRLASASSSFFRAHSPRAFPSPWSSVASASAIAGELRSAPTRRSSRGPWSAPELRPVRQVSLVEWDQLSPERRCKAKK